MGVGDGVPGFSEKAGFMTRGGCVDMGVMFRGLGVDRESH